ncbi:hypothetical protein PFISCL1PPCAC_15344, partial [Pristionchus fissidentatus]
QRWMDKDYENEEDIIYSDEETHPTDSRSEDGEGEEWKVDWNSMECIDEYGDDGEGERRNEKILETSSSEEESEDFELNAVDELGDSVHETAKQNKETGSDDDKNESSEEGTDRWSRWIGVDRKKQNEDEKRTNRGDKKKEESEHERRGDERKERRGDERTIARRREEKSGREKPTLAELVLSGAVKDGEVRKDNKSRMGMSPSRRGGKDLRRSPPSRYSSSRRGVSPNRKEEHREGRRRERSAIGRVTLPHVKKISVSNRSPPRVIRRPSPSTRKERSPHRTTDKRHSFPRMERSPPRRAPSPLRKERSPAKRVPSLPQKERSPLGRGPSSHRKERSPPHRRRSPTMKTSSVRRPSPSPIRKEEGRRSRISPSRRDDRPHLSRRSPSPKDKSPMIIPRKSSPNRVERRRSRSPIPKRIDKKPILPRLSSPNRVRMGSRSPRREERRRENLPSLMEVKTVPPLMTVMVGRIEEDKDKERRQKERDERDEKRKEKEKEIEMKEKKEEEQKGERKRHVPIVWNAEETGAKKIYRSVGHMDGIDSIEKMVEKRKDEKKEEKPISGVMIPLSMAGRVGKCSAVDIDRVESKVPNGRVDIEIKKREDLVPRALPIPIPTPVVESKETANKIEPTHPKPKPKELVRTIHNEKNESPRVEFQSKICVVQPEEGEESDQWEDEVDVPRSSGIQSGGIIGVHKRELNPTKAAFRLFDRATASAVSSSTMKDSKPVMGKEMAVKSVRDVTKLFGDGRDTRDLQGRKRLEEMERDSVRGPNIGTVLPKNKRRQKKHGHRNKNSQSGIRLMEVYH